jgi:hypothetical protein
VAGYYYDPKPEELAVIAPSASVGLKLLTTPVNTYTFDVVITIRELG